MIKFILAAALSIALTTTAMADRLVTHNGSLMSVTQDRVGIVRIIYLDPRQSLKEIGLHPGILLIQGTWVAPGRFEGIANVFACGLSWPYSVQGGIAPDGMTLLLEGPAPIIGVGGWGCGLSGYSWNSDNAHLAFVPYGGRGGLNPGPSEYRLR